MALQSTLPHKSSHATGGTDALTPHDIGAAPASDATPDIANSALELRDNEDTGAVALKCDAVYPQDNPWSVLFPDKFCTAIGAVKGYGDGEPPNENIAPAAMELRDNEDLGVALKLDSSTPEKWFIEKPEALRAAIGAAAEDHVHPLPTPADIGAAPASENASVADKAKELFDIPNDTSALKIYDGETWFYEVKNPLTDPPPEFQDPTLYNQHLHKQKLFCEAVGAEPTITTLPVSKGGTGATTAAGALTALGAVQSNTAAAQGGTQLLNMVQITQAAYSAIVTPTANTLYIIVG